MPAVRKVKPGRRCGNSMMRKSENVMIVLAFLTAFTLHLLLFSYSPIIPLVIKEMEISHAEAGLIFSISILAIIVLRIPWGFLSDYLGVTTTMKMAMVFVGVFSLLRGFSPNYFILLASQLFLGVGFAAILPCLAKIVNAMFRERAGFATGVYVSGFPIGELVGLGLASRLLALRGDWRMVFQIFGLWSLALTVLWWQVGRKSPLEQRPSDERSRREFKDIIGIKQIWILTGLCICSMGCYDTLLTWLPHMLELKGVPPTEASITASMFPVGFLLAGPVVGTLSDKVGLRKPFIWILGLSSAVLIVLIPQLTQLGLWGAILLAGFTLSGILTLVLVILSEHPGLSRFVGSAVGLVSSMGNIGSFLFPIVVGFLIDITGSPTPPLTVLAIISGATIMLDLAVTETGKARPASGCTSHHLSSWRECRKHRVRGLVPHGETANAHD